MYIHTFFSLSVFNLITHKLYGITMTVEMRIGFGGGVGWGGVGGGGVRRWDDGGAKEKDDVWV